MNISEIFNLGKTQHELDFVDIDLAGDVPLFVDPHFLGRRPDAWCVDATRTLNNFFQTFLDLVRGGNVEKARELFLHLNEPNETRLGMSKGKPQGRGVGKGDAERIFQSLLESRAIKTGLLTDLEDCRLFVRNIDKDKTSDMTTNIIRRHLLDYTISQATLWCLPLTKSVPSGDFWDRASRSWKSEYADALIVNGAKILLVPKAIVSFNSNYTSQKYYQHFVLNFLQNEHLQLNTALVQTRRNKQGKVVRRWVTKKSLAAKVAKYSKDFLADFTLAHSAVLEDFKERMSQKADRSKDEKLSGLSIEEIAVRLRQNLVDTPPGNATATKYHRLVVGILELAFFPNLTCPQVEREIHNGRKRIDLTFDNAADKGFFSSLEKVHKLSCQYIHVECKNYSKDVANPELDQLAGRFSPNRGTFGLLLCRSVKSLPDLLKRCTDTYNDGRGLILPIIDTDLEKILEALSQGDEEMAEVILTDRRRDICLA